MAGGFCHRHNESMQPPAHIHLLEPQWTGHGPLWLRYLVEAFLPCVPRITITHPDRPDYAPLMDLAAASAGRVVVRALPWRDGRDAWRGMVQGAGSLGADLTILMFLDTLVQQAADEPLDRLLASRVWGLWFLPAPRRELTAWNPRFLVSASYRKKRREQQLLRAPPRWLSGAWVLDSSLAGRISPRPGQRIEVLPDPWPSQPGLSKAGARGRLGLPADQTLFLHAGTDHPRKGLPDAIAAWGLLEDLPQAVLVRAGATDEPARAALQPLLQAGRARLVDRRLDDEELDAFLCASDWILLPYRRHEGSSGLLAGAAAAGRPVITSGYGVVGARVHELGLGLTYAHLSVPALAGAVREACATSGGRFGPGLATFAGSHTVEALARQLRQSLGLPAA